MGIMCVVKYNDVRDVDGAAQSLTRKLSVMQLLVGKHIGRIG